MADKKSGKPPSRPARQPDRRQGTVTPGRRELNTEKSRRPVRDTLPTPPRPKPKDK